MLLFLQTKYEMSIYKIKTSPETGEVMFVNEKNS